MTQFLMTGLFLSAIVFSFSHSINHNKIYEELGEKIAGIVNSMKEKRQAVLGEDTRAIKSNSLNQSCIYTHTFATTTTRLNYHFYPTDSVPPIVALIAETGDARYLGQVVKAGMEKAASDIEELCFGSADCSKPVIQYFDTRSSPANALELFKESYSKGVRLFVGLITSAEAAAVAEYASDHATDAILISPTSTATELCKYKKQLYRLTMDDRGFAEVLFDLCIHTQQKKSGKVSVQVIYREDLHGQGLYNDIVARFSKNSNEGFKVLQPIAYGSDNLSSIKIKDILTKVSTNEENSFVVVVGLSEIESILEEAAKQDNLRSLTWLLSDAVVLSNLKVPDTMRVFGLSFQGAEPDSKIIRDEHNELITELLRKGLPPMKQSFLAYDTISLINELYSKSQTFSSYVKSTMASEGLTGSFDFTVCHERASGSYVFAARPRQTDVDNPLGKVVTGSKWLVISNYNVELSNQDYNSNRFLGMTLQEDLSAEAMMELNLQSTSKGETTSTTSPAVSLDKRKLLKTFMEIEGCVATAYIIASSKDEISMSAVNTTYTIGTLPEKLFIPARHGVYIEAGCKTGFKKLQITRRCPPSKIAGTELICTTETSSKPVRNGGSLLQQLDLVAKSSSFCSVSGTACNVGSAACSFVSWFAPLTCSAVGVGCGVLGSFC